MKQTHQRAPVYLPAFVIVIGLLLRFITLGVDARFHPDEALFATQARLISHEGDWLLRTTDLDKPPLTFYVTALSFRVLGPTEFAARLPNVLFSAMSIAVLIALARVLYDDLTLATLAGLLLAISPYDLAFSATTFTDIQATFWVLIAAWCAVRDHWPWAGIAAVLAFAAKPNALLFLPLILALGIAQNADRAWRWRDILRRLWRFTWPFVVGIGIIVLWDAARAPRSFWDLGVQRNNPGRWIRSDEVWPRLDEWRHWLNFITGSGIVNGLVVVGGAIGLISGLRQRSRAVVTDWLIVGGGIVWLTCHWLIAFNTYDRYLHTLVPFAALLIARVMMNGARIMGGALSSKRPHPPTPSPTRWRGGVRRTPVLLTIALLALILPHTITALQGDLPLGGDQGQHTGINVLATYLKTELPGETVYDHWLGWELAYYLGHDPHVHLIYQPLPEALADTMRSQTHTCYFVAPSPAAAAPWLDALRHAGIAITPVYQAEFIIYALEP